MNDDFNVLALIKGTERYVFLYDDVSRAATLQTIGRFADDPTLSLTWHDATALSDRLRQDHFARRCD